jgi:hypothetical protein
LRNAFKSEGVVRLLRASIGGDLDCEGARFGNERGLSFAADGANVGKSVIFRRASFDGAIRLSQAVVGGDVDCSGAAMIRGIGADGPVLLAEYVRVQGNVHFCDEQGVGARDDARAVVPTFTTDGTISLEGAAVFGELHCEGATFVGFETNGLTCESAKAGSVKWRRIRSFGTTELNLINAHVGTFFDDKKSWPAHNRLRIDGFSYEYIDPLIDDHVSRSVDSRLRWLQRSADVRTQPYQQLAKVLREGGQDLNARRVLAALEKNLREVQDTTRIKRAASWLYGTIGYGYTPVAGTMRWAAVTHRRR